MTTNYDDFRLFDNKKKPTMESKNFVEQNPRRSGSTIYDKSEMMK